MLAAACLLAVIGSITACTNAATTSAPALPAPTAPTQPVPTATPTPVPSPIPTPPKPDKIKFQVASVTPSTGTYGVGIPISITFTGPVPKKYRDEAEHAVAVTANKTIYAAWSWTSDTTMTLRPQKFWPAGTRLRINGDLTGTRINQYDKNRIVKFTGGRDTTIRIGRAQVIRINAKTVHADVYRNGEKIRTLPVSLGKPGWETRSGTKVIMERYKVRRMTSAELGADEYYDLQVPYALRITNTGEFLHAAPWAQSRLGRWNGSHGCTNLSLTDAKWVFDTALMGDPVITVGTKKPMETWNGYGGPWNVTWRDWLDKSATGWFTITNPARTA